MKYGTNGRIFGALVLLAFTLVPAALADDKGCSNSSLWGTFAFTGTGAFVAPPSLAGPVAEVGTQSFDGVATTSYKATLSQNGNIVAVTAVGTYLVNSDCTGTMVLSVAPFGITLHIAFTIDNTGNEFHAIETETGLVVTRIARKQFPGNGGGR